MPGNYQVIWQGDYQQTPEAQALGFQSGPCTVIAGYDSHGWTLDDYVLPRLASGMYHGREITLEHPVLKLSGTLDFKVEVVADNSGKWCGNARTFDTTEAAAEYAVDLASRWTLVQAWRVVDNLGKVYQEGYC
jgi:hypothetical protein